MLEPRRSISLAANTRWLYASQIAYSWPKLKPLVRPGQNLMTPDNEQVADPAEGMPISFQTSKGSPPPTCDECSRMGGTAKTNALTARLSVRKMRSSYLVLKRR